MHTRPLPLVLTLVLVACSVDPEATDTNLDEPTGSEADQDDPWSVPATWDVVERDITFESDGVRLAGTLHALEGLENGPALVVVQQTNTHFRDQALFLQLVETYNAIGYSVFTYDRRGYGESEGEPGPPRYDTLARDAVAAKRAIGEDEAVDPGKVGFWGMSQSGWLAMEAAGMSDPAFVVSVAAPLTTPGEQMEYRAHNYTFLHHGEEAAQQALELRRAVYGEYFRDELDFESARDLLAEAEDEPWFEWASPVSADQLPEEVEGSSWIDEMDYDPVPAFEGVEAPMLFLQGGEDFDVPVERTLEIAEEVGPPEGTDLVVVPGATHTMTIEDDLRDYELEPGFVSNSSKYFMIMGEWLGRLGLHKN